MTTNKINKDNLRLKILHSLKRIQPIYIGPAIDYLIENFYELSFPDLKEYIKWIIKKNVYPSDYEILKLRRQPIKTQSSVAITELQKILKFFPKDVIIKSNKNK